MTVTQIPRPKMMKLTTLIESTREDKANTVDEVIVHVQGILIGFKLPPVTKQTRLYVTFNKRANSTNNVQGKWKGDDTGNNRFNLRDSVHRY